MRNFTLGLFLLLLSVFAQGQVTISPEMEFAQQKLSERGEIYFSFPQPENATMMSLFNQISVDGFKNGQVYAYANSPEFETFLSYGISFTPVYDYYNTSKALNMATTVAQMASWDRYPTHAVYLQMLDNFVTNYPALCKLETIGTSNDGYPIKCLVISDNINTPEDEPEFWWSGTMHGDETTGYIMLLRMADYLLSNYGTNAEVTNLVQNMEIYINPLANPDGTFYGSTGGTSVSTARRYNHVSTAGADLNRSFPRPDGGTTEYPIQTETQCMMDYAANHDFVMSANTHGGTECVNYPWDTWLSADNPHADNNWWYYVSFVYANEVEVDAPTSYFDGPGSMYTGGNNTTGVTHGADWYYAYGSRQDYMNYYRNCREVTLEISDTKLLGTENLVTHWGYNRDAMLLYMEQALYGFRGIVTDACTGTALSDVKVEITGHDTDNSFVYSSAPVGNYHRPVYAGTYNVTFSKTGYTSKTLPVTVTNDNSTRLDVELVPTGVAVPNFSGAPLTVFEGQSVSFTNSTSGTVTSSQWTFEGGTPGTSAAATPPAVSYATAGTYDVTLEVVSGGCTVSELKPDYITVSPAVPPVADFSANATTVSQGSTVIFTDLSTNVPTSWSWTFDGGTPGTSSSQNPSIVYNTPGTYNVTLIATNAYGSDTETKTAYITVTESDLIMSDGTSTRCSGLFKDSGGDSNYGDNFTYTHTIYPSTPGAFVRLSFSSLNLEPNGTSCYDYITIYDGESTSDTEIGTYCGTDYTIIGTNGVVTSSDASGALTIYFSSDANTNESGWIAEISCYSTTDPPTANFTSDVTSTCTGEVQFSDQSIAATSWLWNFGDGGTSTEQDPQYTYTANGTYTVSLTATNAYGTDVYSVTGMITVDMPVAPITTGASACGAATLNLSATGSGTLSWYDAATNGNQVATGNSYSTLFNNTTTLYVQSEIENLVTDNAGAANNSIGTGGYFTNTNVHGLIFDAEQDFTIVSVYMYSGATANKTITLKNSSDVTIASATVSVPTGGARITLNFDVPAGTGYKLLGPASPNLYRNTAGGSYPYEIDGVVSINNNTAANLAYYYYFYDWEIEYNVPCISARTPVTATINSLPTDVTVTGGGTQCGGSMTLNATGGTGGTIYWQNTTNNGTSTATASASQSVSTTGTYYFRAQSAQGCWGNQGSASVTINSVPAGVNVTGGGTQCGGSITLNATGGTGGTIYWQNTTNNGTSIATASASQSVSETGTYYFRAQSAQGCWGNQGSATVTINPLPSDVTVTGGGTQCGGSMTLNATGGTGGTIYWQNTTNNGTSNATATASQSVSASGTYYFRAQSAQGCWGNQGSATVEIYPAFTAIATSTDESSAGANDGSVTVNMTGGTTPFSGLWSPSGTTNTSGNSMTLDNLTGGYYSVTVMDANGCTAYAGATVNTSGSAPVAGFDADEVHGCDNLTVSFTDLSNNNPTSWAWDFGDGNTSNGQNPVHTYLTAGEYTVSLEATNEYGNDTYSVTDFVTVGETPVLSMSMTEESTSGNDGTASVSANGGLMPYIFVWNNSGASGTINGLTAGEYCVTVTEARGCAAEACIVVYQEGAPIPPVANFEADNTEACGTLTVNFTDLSTNNPDTWLWDFGDGSETSSETNPVHTYTTAGSYTVSLSVSNSDGTDQLTIAGYITVFSRPQLGFTVVNESGIGMSDGQITLEITEGTGPFTINWSNNAHGLINDGLTAGIYSVAVVDDNGCMNTGTAEVQVLTLVNTDVVSSLSVYPNPASDIFYIESEQEITMVQVFDATGRLCFEEKVCKTSVEISVKLNSGVYLIKVLQGETVNNLRIVIK